MSTASIAFSEGAKAFTSGKKPSDNPYDAKKAGVSRQAAYDWDHGYRTQRIRLGMHHRFQGETVREDDVEIGQVVGDLHTHQILIGQFAHWDAAAPFDISEEMFLAMLANIPTKSELIQNKMGRLVSYTLDVDGNVATMLIIYRYDFQCKCIVISNPNHSSN